MTNTTNTTIKNGALVKSTKSTDNTRVILVDAVSRLTDTTSERMFLDIVAQIDKNGLISGKSIDYRNELAKAVEIVAHQLFNDCASMLPVMTLKNNYFVIEFQSAEKLVKENGLYSSFLKKKDTETKARKEKTQQEKVMEYLKKSGLKKAELLKLIETM